MKMYIDGEWVKSESDRTMAAVNPATGQRFEEVPRGNAADFKKATDAAVEAFSRWRSVPASQRADLVLRAALRLKEVAEAVAKVDTTEVGKPINEARKEAGAGASTGVYFAGLAGRIISNVVDSNQPEKFSMVVRRPVGVVGLITPWNDPVSLAMWGIAPALVTGNTVVFKPSSLSSVVSSKLVEIFHEVGLPKGVLNMVTGGGGEVGEALVKDDKVRMTVFTGETATGKHIAEANAPMLRKQVMELGGKNPLIVAKDANLEVAVRASLYAAFSSAGQKCTAASRIIVEEPIAKKFTDAFVAGTSNLVVGNGMREDVEVGPLISKHQQERAYSYVDRAKAEGAQTLTGAEKYTDGERARGSFVQPTVFGDITSDMKLFQDEVFGPVISIIEVKDTDEAIDVANNTRYGLSSAIYTNDIRTAFKAIYGIDAGLTFVNQGTVGPELGVPFGGIKDSGFGRELGEEALEHFTEKKTVFIDYSYSRRPWYFPWNEGKKA